NGTITPAAAIAISRNGSPVAPAPATRPPTAGPTIMPTEPQVTDGHTREPPGSVSSSANHAAPVVHTTPYATPNSSRPTSSNDSDGAASARHDTHSTTPASRVHRRAPSRSAAIPAGTETASVASPGSASNN